MNTPPIPPAVPGEMAMNTESPECEHCHTLVDLRENTEHDGLCDSCAHEVVAALAAENAVLKLRVEAAEAELIAERNLHGQTKVVVGELNIIANDLSNAGKPQFIRSEAIRLLREDQAQLRGQLASANAALEEAAQLKKNYKFTSNSLDEATQEIMTLRAQLEEARRDGERMDMLENQRHSYSAPPFRMVTGFEWVWVDEAGNTTLRQAIDAARGVGREGNDIGAL